eukprot:m.171622 g.171622  ORF g.171622 m.171622 type:complete len:318 (-) comp13499_c1_seq11:1522-2475(-)
MNLTKLELNNCFIDTKIEFELILFYVFMFVLQFVCFDVFCVVFIFIIDTWKMDHVQMAWEKDASRQWRTILGSATKVKRSSKGTFQIAISGMVFSVLYMENNTFKRVLGSTSLPPCLDVAFAESESTFVSLHEDLTIHHWLINTTGNIVDKNNRLSVLHLSTTSFGNNFDGFEYRPVTINFLPFFSLLGEQTHVVVSYNSGDMMPLKICGDKKQDCSISEKLCRAHTCEVLSVESIPASKYEADLVSFDKMGLMCFWNLKNATISGYGWVQPVRSFQLKLSQFAVLQDPTRLSVLFNDVKARDIMHQYHSMFDVCGL